MKKLFRSKEDKMFGGVLGGLGEYFGVDSTLLRLFYAAFTIFTAVAPGIFLYIMALIIIPQKRGRIIVEENKETK